MGLGFNSTLGAYAPPLGSYTRKVRDKEGKQITFIIHTARVPGGVDYIYNVYLKGDDHNLVLDPPWISNPGDDDLLEALHRYHIRKKEPK